MRFGEIKFLLEKVQETKIEFQDKYGGQAFFVNNFFDIFGLIFPLKDYSWSGEIPESICVFVSEDYRGMDTVELNPQQKSDLENYFNGLKNTANQILPFLDDTVREQDNDYINIKLPNGITDPKKLNDFIKDISNTLNKLVVSNGMQAQIEFVGFDTGTNWLVYKVIFTGHLAVAFLMGCVGIANDMILLKKNFYEADNARMLHETMVREHQVTKTFEQSIDALVSNQLKNNTHDLCMLFEDKIDTDDNRFEQATREGIKKLKEQIESGTEYHPSLNPPEFIAEEKGTLKLDYKELKLHIDSLNSNLQIEDKSEHLPLNEDE